MIFILSQHHILVTFCPDATMNRQQDQRTGKLSHGDAVRCKHNLSKKRQDVQEGAYQKS
jgi:hypothetical protein